MYMKPRIFKCKHCGAEVFYLPLAGYKKVLCDTEQQVYWSTRDSDTTALFTPNGEIIYGSLSGDPQYALGIGYIPHNCYREEA